MSMKIRVVPAALLALSCVAAVTSFGEPRAASPASGTVTMTVTAVGKERKQISGWTKAEKLYLAVLIDDSLDTSAASQWNDLKEFLTAQPESTYELVAYARNATAMVAQDFTNDHALAAKALRIPLGTFGAYGSPYLSLLDLMKRWQSTGDRRSILLVSSGIDYFRGGFTLRSPDLDSVIERAEKGNINVWSIYSPAAGHRSHSFFRINNAQSNLSALADETGAESYFLGTSAPVSFKPYL